MLLPTARGPLSAGVIAALLDVGQNPPPPAVDDPEGADFQLALWISLEDGFAPEPGQRPAAVRWRAELSRHWTAALRERTTPAVREAGGDTASPARIGDHLISLVRTGHTALHSFIETKATAAQIGELLTARSLTAVERVPTVALAAHNTMRVMSQASTATAAGHRAASAALSLLSERKLAAGLHRLGLPHPAPQEVGDAAEQRWTRALELCRDHLSANPARTQDLLHAAAAAVEVEARLCRHLLRCWTQATPVLGPQRPVAVTVIGGERVLTPPTRLGTP